MIISKKKEKVSTSDGASKIFRAALMTEDEISREREHFWCLGLNAKNVVQFVELVHLGSATACTVHPREVFRMAVMKGCISVVVAHNHPSGDLDPSKEDVAITKKLKQSGDVLGIPVHDHLIISNENETYFSFADNGIIQNL